MNIRDFTLKILSTFFYAGYFPFIPGTFASILGICLFYLIRNNIFMHILLTLSLIILGFLISGRAERMFAKKDAPFIVIDEVSGMLLSLVFIPYDVRLAIIAFIIFRILDTFKPYPAGRLEDLLGSWGIMGDDIIAGLYTNLILQVVLRVASFRAS